MSRLERLFGIDLRALAALRIGLSLLMLFDLADRWQFLAVFHSDSGLLPWTVFQPLVKPGRLSLYWLHGSSTWAAALFALHAGCAALLLIGWHTRLATIGCWVMFVSLQYGNPLVCNSGDTVLRLLLFWSLFLPLGARASLDCRRRRQPDETNGTVLSVASAALLLQIAFIYLFSVVWKSNPYWLQDGTAMYYVLNLDEYTRPLGQRLLALGGTYKGLTVGTLALELLGPLLAFIPWRTESFRTLAAVLFMLFHLSLAVLMELHLFSYVCIVGWLAFLPPSAWDRLTATASGRGLGWCWDALLNRLNRWLPDRPGPAKQWPRWLRIGITQVVPAVCLVYIMASNVEAIVSSKRAEARRLARQRANSPATWQQVWSNIEPIGNSLGLTQTWRMFARPPRVDGWWLIEAHLADGQVVDLFREGAPFTLERPPVLHAHYPSPRWRKYLSTLWGSTTYRPLVKQYGDWLRREWNTTHPDGQRVTSLRVFYRIEYTMPPGEPPMPFLMMLYEWTPDGERVVSRGENVRHYLALEKGSVVETQPRRPEL